MKPMIGLIHIPILMRKILVLVQRVRFLSLNPDLPNKHNGKKYNKSSRHKVVITEIKYRFVVVFIHRKAHLGFLLGEPYFLG